jgi:hypothetical protein
VIVWQEHGRRCSALMVQFADSLSVQHLARPPSWDWLDGSLKQFCEVRIRSLVSPCTRAAEQRDP